MTASRREFLESAAATAAALNAAARGPVPFQDGPANSNFFPVPLQGNTTLEELAGAGVSKAMAGAIPQAPRGAVISWGIPFQLARPILLKDREVTEPVRGLKAGWLVFCHTADVKPLSQDERGFIRPMRGEGFLGEHVADYAIVYADGTEARSEIRRRHQIGALRRQWGENCFQAVAHRKPHPIRTVREQPSMLVDMGRNSWGNAETRVNPADGGAWINWLWAWQNPHPEKEIAALRFTPRSGITLIAAISAGGASSHPLRWLTRQKAILRLPENAMFDHTVDRQGSLRQIQLDMGQVISAEPRRLYPNEGWEGTYNNRVPEISEREVVIEYCAHPDARFHLEDGSRIPVSELATQGPLIPVEAATRRVKVRVREKASGRLVPVKLHIHGESGEYLPPVDRHRQPNLGWFEDYAPEFQHQGRHYTTYIAGETTVDLPLGKVYLEVSKGFEIKPVRKTIQVERSTEVIDVAIEKLLPWRERGWVTADTHVHFLSPATAQLEGCAEGVNVVNLLASQWGELMTNVGDFDGKTTFGSREAGGDGEWLVRVGTENLQHVLGHISLLGYK